MLTADWGGIRWRLSPLFPALLVVLLSFEAAAPVGRCVAAAFWHESGHMLAMLCCRRRPRSVTLGAFGIRMEQDATHPLSYTQNIAVSLAGPLMNGMAAALTWRTAPALCGVHLTLMVFNLLPLSMLDGGEVVYSLLALHLDPAKAARLLRYISYGLLCLLYAAGLAVLFGSGYNLSLLLTALYLTAWMFFNRND